MANWRDSDRRLEPQHFHKADPVMADLPRDGAWDALRRLYTPQRRLRGVFYRSDLDSSGRLT